MAKKQKISKEEKDLLWGGVTEKDFENEAENVYDKDIGEYDKRSMTYFSQNVNLMRHLPRLADSLKPVERRGLYTLYEDKAFPGTRSKKSSVIVGDTMTYHPHGDGSIYGTLVGMAQPFTNPVPMVQGTGNFGNDIHPNGNAAMRYTEMTMSNYAQDCFFSDYDDDCIEKIFNTSRDEDEPLALPCKYPNILVNGGFGIATGNAFCVPTYSIPDIVKLTKKLLRNPDYDDIYIMPDSPTGCDIVDNGSLREICDTGTGVLKMRSTITIEENPKRPNVWILRVHNLPWMVSIDSITDALTKYTKDGVLPIKDIEDHSYTIKVKSPNGGMTTRKQVQYDIIVNKAHDPNQIKMKLYKLTQLEKSISVNFKVVTDALAIDRLNMRDLVLTWIDIRREYLRRLVNKKISKITARISLMEIMIVLTSKDNLEKTLKIIKNNNEEDAVEALMKNKQVKINSYQAEKIVDSKLRAFTKDANAKYKKELEKLEKELKKYLDMTKSSKKIDDIIEEQLEDLMKYHIGRRSNIVAESSSVKIPNTDHYMVVTKLGMIKKLPYKPEMMVKKKTPALGAFKNQDYPLKGLVINNHDSLMMFDNFGRYSCVPVHEIENTEPSQLGSRVYDVSKLNGEIVETFQFFAKDLQTFVKETMNATISIVTLTKNGYLKKTPIEEFTKIRNQMNVRAMKIRQDDELIAGKIIIEKKGKGSNMLIYTEKGIFSYIHSDNIAVQSKDASGLLSIKLDPDDFCKGICIIGDNDANLLVVTEKGNLKQCELGYLGEPGKRKISSYLATLDPTDKINFVDAIEDDVVVTVCTRTTYQQFHSNDIPVKTRKAKCVKMVPVPVGNNIISVTVDRASSDSKPHV